jgi:sigma-B regulation protein RsbU (phosphoserine phosphatase)
VSRRRRPGRRSTFARARDFVRDYTAGVGPGELRRLVDRDASRVYSVLMRDRPTEGRELRGVKRVLRDAKLLFLSVSEKLTPGRRLLFAVSLIAAALGFAGFRFTVNSPDYGFRVDASPLAFLAAIAGLLFLLTTELVDRVLVRDELEVARELQRELLPSRSPDLPGWSFAHSSRTANEIGGDYYGFQDLSDGELAVIVADASGHGMAAGLLMAIADASLRIALDLDPSPAAVARLVNRALNRAGDRRSFVTLFYGRLDPRSGRLDYVCAGHPPPLVRRADGTLEEPGSGSLPLGLRPDANPALGTLRIGLGDRLVLFTDGLFEAPGATGEAFGYERLRREVAASTGAADAHDRLRAAVERHAAGGELADDLTIVVLEHDAVATAT